VNGHSVGASANGLFFEQYQSLAFDQVGSLALLIYIQRYIGLCNEWLLVPKWSYGVSREPQPLAA
jgi:hypothetical protein